MKARVADRAGEVVDIERVGVDNDQRRIAAQPLKHRTAERPDPGPVFDEDLTLAPIYGFQHAANGEAGRGYDRPDHPRVLEETAEEYRPLGGILAPPSTQSASLAKRHVISGHLLSIRPKTGLDTLVPYRLAERLSVCKCDIGGLATICDGRR